MRLAFFVTSLEGQWWSVNRGSGTACDAGHDRARLSSVSEDCRGPSGWKSPTRPLGIGFCLETVVVYGAGGGGV